MMQDKSGLGALGLDPAGIERFYRYLDPVDLVRGGRVVPRWLPDGHSFWYAEGAPDETVIHCVDGLTGAKTPLFDVAATRAALARCIGRELPYAGLPFAEFSPTPGGETRFLFEGKPYLLAADGQSVRPALVRPEDAFRAPALFPRWRFLDGTVPAPETPSPDGQWFAGTRDGDLTLRSPVDNRVVRLTHEAGPRLRWIVEAARTKLSIKADRAPVPLQPWSPDGTHLFVFRIDSRAVDESAFVHFLKPRTELETTAVPPAGGAMDHVEPYVLDATTLTLRRLQVDGTEDSTFALIGWLPDGSEVLFCRYNRTVTDVTVLAGNPRTGAVRTLFAERDDAFLHNHHELLFGGETHARLVPDGSGLVWRSGRSGYEHFYLYGLDGTLRHAITAGEFPVYDVEAFDLARGLVYFTAHPDLERPYDLNLCRAPLAGGGPVECLTPADGHNQVFVSPDAKCFVAINSRQDRPFRSTLYSADGKPLAELGEADVSRLAAIGFTPPEEAWTLAEDGVTRQRSVLFKPADFDPALRYPVVEWIYAGPQVAVTPRSFHLGSYVFDTLFRAMAELGFVVVATDARGTPDRSKAFHQHVYRRWGQYEIADHAAALRQLAADRPYMDLGRVGIWGHSWGGYHTIRALIDAPDLYRAGVASAPGLDQAGSILGEPYFGLPADAPEIYRAADLLPLAAKLQGALMMIGGTSDWAIYAHMLRFSHRLMQLGIDHEVVPMAGAGHGYGGVYDDWFVRKLIGHFVTHLGRPSA